MIAIGILIVVVVVLFVAAVIRLVWSVARGNMQIEPSSYGRHLLGRRNRDGS